MGRKAISDSAKNMSRPLRVLLTDDEREALDNAAAIPQTGDSPTFRGTGTWARDALLTIAPHAEDVEANCQQHGLSLPEFIDLAIQHQLSRKRPK